MATIILTGGGTAGHCAPCLSLIPYLKEKFDNIYYIGSIGGIEEKIVKKQGITYYGIPCAKLIRSFNLKNLTIPFKVISGIRKAVNIIDDVKPDVIFSKGGYVSVPTVVAGKLKKIPVIAHESDYTIGLANKITAKMCKKVLTAFPETALSLKNGEYTGSPIKKLPSSSKNKLAYSEFGFSGEKPIILVLGGSQGSKDINNAVKKATPELENKFDVIHITGKGNLDKSINLKGYYQTEFLFDIEKALSIADVAVSRGGSNALFELLSMEIPAVIIPLPKGVSRGDQVLNANYFQKMGLISLLPQENLTPESLAFSINSTYLNRHNVKRSLKKHPIKDKSKEIADIICDYAKVKL